VLIQPDLGHGPGRAPSRTAGGSPSPSRAASVSTARAARAGMRLMAAWKGAHRAASYSAWKAGSSLNQLRNVDPPCRRGAAFSQEKVMRLDS